MKKQATPKPASEPKGPKCPTCGQPVSTPHGPRAVFWSELAEGHVL